MFFLWTEYKHLGEMALLVKEKIRGNYANW